MNRPLCEHKPVTAAKSSITGIKMKICVAQTRPLKGNIQGNIEVHKNFTKLAASNGAEVIIFSELSLTGYEPALAGELGTTAGDARFQELQALSNTLRITIGAGVPLREDSGICISMIFFRPDKERQVYSKQYLHADEELFFIAGQSQPLLKINEICIAPAICYELTVPEHAERACENKAEVYLVSVAKSVAGLDQAHKRLAEVGKKYSMTVLLSNCTGEYDGMNCGGKTAAWNTRGRLKGQLDDTSEGLLIYDTLTEEVRAVYPVVSKIL